LILLFVYLIITVSYVYFMLARRSHRCTTFPPKKSYYYYCS